MTSEDPSRAAVRCGLVLTAQTRDTYRAVATGRFESPEALVVEAIRRMEGMEVPNQQLAEIRSKIDEGYAQALRGELVNASRVREQLARRARRGNVPGF